MAEKIKPFSDETQIDKKVNDAWNEYQKQQKKETCTDCGGIKPYNPINKPKETT